MRGATAVAWPLRYQKAVPEVVGIGFFSENVTHLTTPEITLVYHNDWHYF